MITFLDLGSFERVVGPIRLSSNAAVLIWLVESAREQSYGAVVGFCSVGGVSGDF